MDGSVNLENLDGLDGLDVLTGWSVVLIVWGSFGTPRHDLNTSQA